MKKIYSAPEVRVIEMDTDAVCLNIGSGSADGTDAGARSHSDRYLFIDDDLDE